MMHEEFTIEEASPSKFERWMRAIINFCKFCLLLAAVPVIVSLHKAPLAEQNAMRAKLEEMKTERDKLTATRDKLLRQVEWIKNDTAYFELRVRDHDGMHKKDEYVIRFDN